MADHRVWMMDEGMTAAPEQRCRTCDWYGIDDQCNAPVPIWAERLPGRHDRTEPGDGEDCATWKAKVRR